MVVIQPGNRRIIRKIAEKKWEVGDPSAPLPFNHFGGFDDITTARLNHDQCVLRALTGMDPNLYIPAPRNCPTFDDKALRAVRTLKQKIKEKVEDIEESIKAAKKDDQHDLVKEYEAEIVKLNVELADLNETTKSDIISSLESRPLDDGDPIKKETRAIRGRKRRAIVAMRKAGLVEEAEDLDRCYVVADGSVIFYRGESDYQWIVEDASASAT